MTDSPVRQIFLSAVTAEFGKHRRLLKGDLSLPRVKVQEQDDLTQGGGKLLQTLDDYIRDDCDAVVHLVGSQIGEPLKSDEIRWLTATYSDFVQRFSFLAEQLADDPPSLTYTQMEAWLALYYNKRCHLYRPSELDQQPLAADHPQQVHWERIRSLGEHRGRFDDVNDLRIKLLRDLHNLWPQDVPTTRRAVLLPYQSLGTLFKGREKILDDLRESLLAAGTGRATAITGKAVHGLGGVGKTRLAVEFAWRHARDFTAVLLVTADSPENLRREVAELTEPLVLDLPEHAATDEEVREGAAVRWLQDHAGWLLILDNVDSEAAAEHVEKLLARLTGGQVLITSRRADWSGLVTPLSLDVLEPEDAASFLLERTRPQAGGRGRKAQASDGPDAATLAKELDGLALALEQAGAYIAVQRITLAEYHTRWQAHDVMVQTWHREREMKYPRSVAKTWETTLEQLDPDAIGLLNLLAWFAPEPLPERVLDAATMRALRAGSDETVDNIESTEAADLRELLAALADFSMLQWDPTAETVTVHRVVQEILRTRQADPAAHLTAALRLLEAAIPDGDSGDVRTWPAWEPLRPHVASAAAEGHRWQVAEPTSFLLGKLGTLLRAKVLYNDAEEVERLALAIDERQFGADSTQVALRLNNLAQTLQDTNRLADAEPLMRRALAIDEQSYGAEHPEVAIRLNNLALLLQATNRLEEAEPMMRRALAIGEKTFGADHPKVALRLNNLARLLQATNRLAEAEPLVRRALAIGEKTFGADHPKVALRLSNLAQLLKATNRLADAEPMMRRALAIDEQSYGAEHPKVALRLNNLALLLQDTNRLAEAEPLMRRAVEILRTSLGEEHPHTVKVAENYRRLREAME